MRVSACRVIATSLLACIGLTGRAWAQEEVYGPDESDLLIAFDATFRHSKADAPSSSTDESETLSARTQLGWFLSRRHELGVELTTDYGEAEAGGHSTVLFLGPYYNFNHWATPRTTLYGGPHAGLTYLDASGLDSETALSAGVHGGMRYWVSPNVALNVEPRFTITDLDDSFGGETTNLDVLFGIAFKL